MIFKCFKCDKNVMVDDNIPLINRADLTIEQCNHCGAKYKVRQYKKARANMRRNILKINYDDSGFGIWFDGTHGEIITGIAIVIKRLQEDGMPLEEAIDWIRDYVENYKHESEE